MFIDARSVPENETIDGDVCIIGAGAAGITLAREFAGRPFRVCLLESGGLEQDDDSQALYRGENIGLPYFPLDATRLRFFGGTTNHWGGWCRPLDEMDFEAREWIPNSGWPFNRSQLTPYYERAQEICQIGPFSYEGEHWEAEGKLPRYFNGARVKTKIYQYSPPTRFGEIYRAEIARAKNIATYLHANVVDVEATRNARTVRRVRVACLGGNRFWVSAKIFILAAGGIENSRLLLNSRKVQTSGLGNQHDLVGRFFMEHPHLYSGLLLTVSPLPNKLYYGENVNGLNIRGLLTLTKETTRREKLGNYSATLHPDWPQSVRSLKHLYGKNRDQFIRHMTNIMSDLDNAAFAVFDRLKRGFSAARMMWIRNRTEQVPHPDSRIDLSTERDSLGMNRARLNWRLTAFDKRTIARGQELVAEEVGRAGAGRVNVELTEGKKSGPAELIGGNHHMGTTRMHLDSKRGVVDEHCRVHGISNLFIAGSSVFPTSGSANPTLTIVALTLRLGDHVKRLFV